MVLPYEIFKEIIEEWVHQRWAEDELCEGFSKHNSCHGPYLDLPLTVSIIPILEKLYKDENDYPVLSWWLFEGEFDEKTLTNKKAFIYIKDEKRCIKTLRELWEYMEELYKERNG